MTQAIPAILEQLDDVTDTVLPLTEVRRGRRCRLELMSIDARERDLLMAMGLTPHCELVVCRAGEPCVVRVGATRLGLAGAVARRLLVRPMPPGARRTRGSKTAPVHHAAAIG